MRQSSVGYNNLFAPTSLAILPLLLILFIDSHLDLGSLLVIILGYCFLSFAAYLKIAPDHMQFEARTLPADISRYVERMQEYAKNEDNAYCREMIQDNIQDIGMGVASNALQHRFFMVFQYESQMRASPNTVQGIIQRLNEEADTARRYLDLCELEVQEPRYADDFALELLYEIINKRTSQRVKLPEGVFDMTTAVHGVYEEQT